MSFNPVNPLSTPHDQPVANPDSQPQEGAVTAMTEETAQRVITTIAVATQPAVLSQTNESVESMEGVEKTGDRKRSASPTPLEGSDNKKSRLNPQAEQKAEAPHSQQPMDPVETQEETSPSPTVNTELGQIAITLTPTLSPFPVGIQSRGCTVAQSNLAASLVTESKIVEGKGELFMEGVEETGDRKRSPSPTPLEEVSAKKKFRLNPQAEKKSEAPDDSQQPMGPGETKEEAPPSLTLNTESGQIAITLTPTLSPFPVGIQSGVCAVAQSNLTASLVTESKIVVGKGELSIPEWTFQTGDLSSTSLGLQQPKDTCARARPWLGGPIKELELKIAEIKENKRALEVQQNEIEERKRVIEAKQNDIEIFPQISIEQIERIEDKLEKLREESNKLLPQLRKQKETLAKLEKKIVSLKKRKSHLETKVSLVKTTLDHSLKTQEQLQSKKQRQKSNFISLKEEIEEVCRLIAVKEAELKQPLLEEQVKQIGQELQSALATLDQKTIEFANLKKEISSNQELIEDNESTIELAKKKNERLSTKIKELDEEIQSTEENLKKAQEELETQRLSQDKLTGEIEESESQLKNLQEEKAKRAAEALQLLTQHANAIRALSQESIERQNKKADLEIKKESLIENIEKLEKERIDRQHALEKIEADRKAEEEKNKQIQGWYQALQSSVITNQSMPAFAKVDLTTFTEICNKKEIPESLSDTLKSFFKQFLELNTSQRDVLCNFCVYFKENPGPNQARNSIETILRVGIIEEIKTYNLTVELYKTLASEGMQIKDLIQAGCKSTDYDRWLSLYRAIKQTGGDVKERRASATIILSTLESKLGIVQEEELAMLTQIFSTLKSKLQTSQTIKDHVTCILEFYPKFKEKYSQIEPSHKMAYQKVYWDYLDYKWGEVVNKTKDDFHKEINNFYNEAKIVYAPNNSSTFIQQRVYDLHICETEKMREAQQRAENRLQSLVGVQAKNGSSVLFGKDVRNVFANVMSCIMIGNSVAIDKLSKSQEECRSIQLDTSIVRWHIEAFADKLNVYTVKPNSSPTNKSWTSLEATYGRSNSQQRDQIFHAQPM